MQPDVMEFSQHPLSPLRSSGWPVLDSPAGDNLKGLDNATASLLSLDELEADHRSEGSEDRSLEIQTPAWLTNADFDLNAFHSSILNASSEWLPDDLPHFDKVNPVQSTTLVPLRRQDAVRRHWFTFLPSHDSGNTKTIANSRINSPWSSKPSPPYQGTPESNTRAPRIPAKQGAQSRPTRHPFVPATAFYAGHLRAEASPTA
ncbi:hypothetical protein ACJZ2D_010783 [Fusarium nematophilum]